MPVNCSLCGQLRPLFWIFLRFCMPIKLLIWIIWTLMSVVPKMPSNLIIHSPASFSLYGQLHPLTLFRIVQTFGTSKQVTFITGFSNTVNAQVCHLRLSGLQEILMYISVNRPLCDQLQSLTFSGLL